MRRLIFLHIPKTAGQSVHSELERLFGAAALAPIRVNTQWRLHRESDLAGHRVFSGHLDWKRLDFVPPPRAVFTVLRDPVDRIASYYLYLKKQGQKLSEEEAARPERRALWLARTLSMEDYFLADLPERRFIDDHYDNFYTHFFAGRHYRARAEHRQMIRRGETTEAEVVDLARRNLASLDFVCDLTRLDLLEAWFLRAFARRARFTSTRVNVNEAVAAPRRFDGLRDHGLTSRVEDRIMEMARLDGPLRIAALADRAAQYAALPETLADRLRRWRLVAAARLTGREPADLVPAAAPSPRA